MHEFEVLADAVRRRMLSVLALGEQPAGMLTDIVRAEFGISQPAVSQHLKVLRENGFATVRAEGTRRVYALDRAGLDAAARALAQMSDPLGQRLDALHTEVARGRRAASDTTKITERNAS
ncbi:DNA-binding transcriptional ArsR family regulator [Microbacterium sp. W4I4]|uniref:ArsR/SmtB family transcription factor n=1 Tax=Microbacterium sp. W4I4 TaxID=3042295 RepID=UPI002782A6D8|nr:metalloregulator ArsR/SmtB family transcription factor [Microbacterium sp. W4I4]MDQ0613743.1 DNA-binding transcriptional ArsR family regulator [Microbacterium sp. W4I4]